MGAMIDYWYYTGDDTWNDMVIQGLLHQVGDHSDYMPNNQTLTEGNDDQGFWGLAVMSAAEQRFPDPPKDKPQYLALAQAVFNTQAARWDTENCNGGLRWQIFTWNKGFDYKNSISQGCFFALAARLALYTGNTSYADWAERAWDWTVGVSFIDDKYRVFDGAHIQTNCSNRIPYQWSYNVGVFINGASAMYKLTGSDAWKERLDGLVKGADVFFVGPNEDIMQEVACETVGLCNTDQQSFKAYLCRWMAAATRWAPHLTDRIMPKLRASSLAAASSCSGGENGQMCGLKWTENGAWDGLQGVGQQMMAMEAVLANLIGEAPEPVTQDGGGTSRGDPAAGGGDIGRTDPTTKYRTVIGPGDTAGAVILTIMLMASTSCIAMWMFMDETSEKSTKQKLHDLRISMTNGSVIAMLGMGSGSGEADAKGKAVERSLDSGEDAARTEPGFQSPIGMHERHFSSPPPSGSKTVQNRPSVVGRGTSGAHGSGKGMPTRSLRGTS